jgi:mRNA-degrading endonuclease toxin of MazEF toxin-antitoxin module
VVIVSNRRDCTEQGQRTVLVVVCSVSTIYADRHDVLIRAPDGGLLFDSIAQTDLVFVVSKRKLTDEAYRGTLQADTLRQILVKVGETVGVPGAS